MWFKGEIKVEIYIDEETVEKEISHLHPPKVVVKINNLQY